MDPAIKLLDARGVEIALSHDTHNLDPFIRYEVKDAGIYHVQLMAFVHPPAADVNLKGSAGHIYRLTLTDQPFARFASPCAVQRGQQAKLNTGRGESIVNAEQCVASDRRIPVPTPDGEVVLAAVVTPPVASEVEPNNDSKQAHRLTAPFAVSGAISQGSDEDRYLFSANKGDTLDLRIHAAALHSLLDASLRIEDPKGKVLQQGDDSDNANPDPDIAFKAPADGDYIAVVHDLFQRGGPEFVYTLEATPSSPHVTATLTTNTVKLDAGKTVELKASVRIKGKVQGKLIAGGANLPPGVTMKEIEVPAKGGEVKLVLKADADAPANAVPVEIELKTSAPDEPMTFKATYDLRGTEPRGDRLINEDSRVWLTVIPSPAAKKAPATTAAP
jgi:hypothetical protein